MDFIIGIKDWVIANWAQILIIYTSTVTIASIVVKITPNKRDNEVLEKILGFVGKVIALNK